MNYVKEEFDIELKRAFKYNVDKVSPLFVFCKNDTKLQEDIDNARKKARGKLTTLKCYPGLYNMDGCMHIKRHSGKSALLFSKTSYYILVSFWIIQIETIGTQVPAPLEYPIHVHPYDILEPWFISGHMHLYC